MNCPSRPDNIEGHPDWNQNPSSLSRDVTTRADFNGIVNLRTQRKDQSDLDIQPTDPAYTTSSDMARDDGQNWSSKRPEETVTGCDVDHSRRGTQSSTGTLKLTFRAKVLQTMIRYSRFIGPGFLIAVAYIDPGNYATDVDAGASTQYAHLFIILMSNLFAIFLQSLCIKLGSVTGLNLAENCRKHLPKWLTYVLYVFAESAIVATDMAEVIGTAIALNLLLKIPLIAGCIISLVDVVVLLLFYNPEGSMTRLRIFEYFVMCLVLGVMICFCIQLSYIHDTSVSEVFRGYVPSSAVVEGNGIYLSCGILGATVMPHSIFLGSGVVQPRLKELDIQLGNVVPVQNDTTEEKVEYQPSLQAIRTSLKYSIFELATSLFTFALFINSAILIVAGSSLYPDSADADLFSIYGLLNSTLGKAAGVLFALALLLSGTSAGIVCTMAGQMVSEGMLNWTIKPWVRRLVTRLISIIPSVVIAGSIGRDGLGVALTASQVVLSVILPFVTAPLLWFTCKSSIMTVTDQQSGRNNIDVAGEKVNMRNGWLVTVLAVLIWLVLVVMNMALLVLVGLGKV